ncbi:hypothetical protein RCG23_13280 [Neobacillus sp. PS3-34]|uniref:hypothetical protein n=1 Tax=Neobacillus sp. PS3-34 TaxID=3070678 RepID=UPI0027DFA8C4|nr:hypothetical protein [Neobacillus sp. PS3-34]WML46627.1 hypothetical protein RCG23_13280 [Neobacillus sp. PS3-34]
MSLITRKDVPLEETWDLTHIFASDEEWEMSYIQVDQDLNEILHGTVHLDSGKSILELLHRYDRLMEKFSRTSSYAFYKYSEDGTDSDNQKMKGRSQTLAKKTYNISTMIVNRFLQLPKGVLKKYMEEEKVRKPIIDLWKKLRRFAIIH